VVPAARSHVRAAGTTTRRSRPPRPGSSSILGPPIRSPGSPPALNRLCCSPALVATIARAHARATALEKPAALPCRRRPCGCPPLPSLHARRSQDTPIGLRDPFAGEGDLHAARQCRGSRQLLSLDDPGELDRS